MKKPKAGLNRREFLITSGIGVAAASSVRKGLAQSETNDSRPNILLIMVDQQHPGYFGYAGHPIVRTPNIDKLAQNGLNFNKAYCGNPLCMPSRAGVFTGLTTRGHRARMNGVTLDENLPTFTNELRKAGYQTKAVGKLHFGTAVKPVGIPIEKVNPRDFPELALFWKSEILKDLPLPYYGFETVELADGHGHGSYGHYLNWLNKEFPKEAQLFHNATPLITPSPAYKLYNRNSYKWALPEELHPTRWIGDRTVDSINKIKKDKRPFFLFSSFQDPHPPFAPPAPWCNRYDEREVPPAKVKAGELDKLPPHYRLQRETSIVTQGSNGEPMSATDPYRNECVAHYFGLIEMVDNEVGRIMEALSKNGLAETTVVIFAADHGEAVGDHGMWGKGPYHIDGVIRVPFIISAPGQFKGKQTFNDVVSLLDLAPTIYEIAGINFAPPSPEAPNAPSALPGKSLIQLMKNGRENGQRRNVLIEEDEDYLGFRMRTLVNDRYRLTTYSGQPYGELFDLQEDPDEFHNLWDAPRAKNIRADLKAELLSKIIETDYPLPRQTARS
ncbi:MAG TPA: sulfatase-like hydrolase/transferase [Pyrinomonadaceae bacterium]|nr:sulfatase-like hydrolase/transferase [Pyrinomonadaceae bacterium]